jgi:HD-GYP domain-containing protein (c-di-GMP phosphodiesterase class II)
MDNYLFSHSVGVAIYSVVVGLGLGYKEGDLTALGIAALLHDIGMTKIQPHILSRKGPLNAQEYDEVKKHTLYGTFMVKDGAPLSKQIKNIISRHHERCDGSGYPKGLKGSEIDEPSQIVGLADTFEALTSPRAYREGMTVYNAMRETLSLSVKAFNPALMRALLEKLALYPVRSLLELNTGQMAIVVGTNDKVPFRPVIRIISDNEKRKVDDLQIVNLLGDGSLYVVGVLKEEDHNVKVVDEF